MPKNRGKITLSELIQTKCSEKPGEYFWEEFSSELDRKMRLETQRNASKYTVSRNGFWVSLRKTTTTCGIVLTCGAFTFLTYNSMQIASVGPTQEESFGLYSQVIPNTGNNEVSYNSSSTINQSPLFVIEEPSESIQNTPQNMEVVAVSTVQDDGLSVNTQDFVMELPNALNGMDIEKLISFDETNDLSGDSITERYMTPLHRIGYTAHSNTHQRFNNRTGKELSEYDISFQSDLSNIQKLDTITLIRF